MLLTLVPVFPVDSNLTVVVAGWGEQVWMASPPKLAHPQHTATTVRFLSFGLSGKAMEGVHRDMAWGLSPKPYLDALLPAMSNP
eukprot:gene26315-biopygen15777